MKKVYYLSFIILFFLILSGCSKKRNDLVMDDIYYISVGDGKNSVVKKIGEPHKKIEGNDAFANLKDEQETIESLYDKFGNEEYINLYDRAESALDNDHLEEWIYNYKNKDGSKGQYELFFDKKEVVYTPSLNSK